MHQNPGNEKGSDNRPSQLKTLTIFLFFFRGNRQYTRPQKPKNGVAYIRNNVRDA
jgi:hypothetical protein